MKTLFSTIVAGGLTLATIGGANAEQYRYGPRAHPTPPPHAYVYGNVAGAVVAGAFLGYALGSILSPPPPVIYPQPYAYVPPAPVAYPPAYYAPLDPHAAWCLSTYGSAYDLSSDTVAYYGTRYRCVSPGGPQG
jgi:hypothetical protein